MKRIAPMKDKKYEHLQNINGLRDVLYFNTTFLSLHLSPRLTHTKEFLVIPNNEIVAPHAATDFYFRIED